MLGYLESELIHQLFILYRKVRKYCYFDKAASYDCLCLVLSI